MRLVGGSNGESFEVRNQKVLRSKGIFLVDLLDSAYGKESWKKKIMLVKTGLVSSCRWSGAAAQAMPMLTKRGGGQCVVMLFV